MRIEPVVNVRFLKPYHASSAGETTPSPLEEAVGAQIASFSNFKIVLDSDDLYRAELCVETSPPGAASGLWLTVQQCITAGAFELMSSYLANLPGLAAPANNFVGQEVLDWAFQTPRLPGHCCVL